MIASDVIASLTAGNPCPGWVQQAALLVDPGKFNRVYETTAVNFFTETTVRVPAVKLCQNGFAFFEFPASELTQAQLDSLFDWTQTEPAAESWEVIADFLGIEQG